ncbi:hypothetical protein GQ457_03G020920 [Hibiscus cannabinus]
MHNGNQQVDDPHDLNAIAIPAVVIKPRAIRDHLTQILDDLNTGIVGLEIQAAHFELKLIMSNMLNLLRRFGVSPHKDAQQHISVFLEGMAKWSAIWFYGIVGRSLPKLVDEIHSAQNDIASFKQDDDESMYESSENQVGQIAQALQAKPQWSLPSNIEVTKRNGNEQCSTLALRSGTTIKKEDKFGGKPLEDSTPSHVEERPELQIDILIEEDKEESSKGGETNKHHVDTTARVITPPARDEVRPPPPFPKRLKKQKEDLQFQNFVSLMDQFHINISFLDAIDQIPSYAKFLKDIVTKKRKVENHETIVVASEYYSGLTNIPIKRKDPSSFIIPCSIGDHFFGKALFELGSNVNLMPKSIFKKLV